MSNHPKQWLSIALWIVVAASTNAQQLSLTTDATVTYPARLRPDGVSNTVVVSVSRTGLVEAADFVTGWQTQLELIPDNGAEGDLSFSGVSEPRTGYIFESINSFGISSSGSGSSLNAFDFQFLASSGVAVDPGTEASLLELTVQASSNAYGSFGLYAVPGLASTEWSDASEPDALRREFLNVRDDGGPVRIGDIRVIFPGDYNADGAVDAADYTVWRDTLDSAVNLSADGDQNGLIDQGDYAVWTANFGARAAAVTAAVIPEPSCGVLLLFSISMGAVTRRRIQP